MISGYRFARTAPPLGLSKARSFRASGVPENCDSAAERTKKISKTEFISPPGKIESVFNEKNENH